jgi:hypothetical protein
MFMQGIDAEWLTKQQCFVVGKRNGGLCPEKPYNNVAHCPLFGLAQAMKACPNIFTFPYT